jgi:hypothetical protein
MLGCIGLALNDLRIYEQAQAVLNEAVTLLDNSSPDLQSHFLAQQIIAALQTGAISLATNRMLTLARVVPLVNSRRLDDDLREVLATSGGWATVPEVRNARDQLKATAPNITS